MGVSSVLGGELAWYAEFDKAPSAILAHHWPHVPNLGDVTKVDWASVPKVDVITGGSPCQDLSHAGKRAGMKVGTRSGLWASMCDAIEIIRPRLVVWENVRGALSASADSAVEPCPICVGDGGRVTLRALGRVLGDLAELGYDAWWYGLRAADVGAAHGRWRVFVFAQPADADDSGLEGLAGQARAAQAGRHGHPESGAGGPDLTLLPTPAVNDMGAAYTPETWDAWTERMKSAHGNGNGHGKSLNIEAQRLLPTPRATRGGSTTETGRLLPTPRAQHGEPRNQNVWERDPSQPQNLENALAHTITSWGEYEAAIRRQEAAFGRPAPLPTEPGKNGQPRLSPAFVEWLMGLPAGHVTGVPGISRNDQLKALGNGVVPPQAAAAARAWLHDSRMAVAS